MTNECRKGEREQMRGSRADRPQGVWRGEEGGRGEEQREARAKYRGKLVAGIADEHARLANGSISNSDTLDELGGAHPSSFQPSNRPGQG